MIQILFLHGTFGQRNDWASTLEFLRGNNPLRAIDLPGHGGCPYREDVNAYDQLRDAVLPYLQQPTLLVGYSLGGRVALRIAIDALKSGNSTIRGLILEGANPGIDDLDARAARRLHDDATAHRIETSSPDAFLDHWYHQPLFGPVAHDAVLRRALVQRRSDSFHPLAAARILRECSPGVVPSMWPHLDRLTIPTHFVAGALDEKYQAIGARFCHTAPASTLTVIPHAGHNTHLEQPRAFADCVNAFANRLLDAPHAL